MAVFLSPVGGVAAQFFNNDGVPLAGGLIYTYAAGTNTPSPTYTTGAGTIAHSNPIVLDSAGRVPGGEIWLSDGGAYKFVIKDANLTLIGTYDNIVGINSNFVNYSASQEIQTATSGQTVFTLTTMVYQPGTNSLSVFVDGVNQYGPGAQYAFTETSGTSVTFVSGLHLGAQVKFTTTIIQNVGAVDAEQVSYNPPFANAKPTNVEAKLAQTVSVADFGASPYETAANNTTYITAALNYAAANDAVLQFGPGTYQHNGISVTGSGFSIVGNDTRLNYVGSSSNDAFVINSESLITTGLSIKGIEFQNGYSCLKIVGVGSQIYRQISITECVFKDSESGMLWMEHCSDVIIDSNFFENGGDNGIYYSFSRNAVISNNILRNCGGSGSITFGYVDGVITAAEGIMVIGNTIYADASAPAPTITWTYGIDGVYCERCSIIGNIMYNTDDSVAGRQMKSGIALEEHIVRDVLVSGNKITNVPEEGIRLGVVSGTGWYLSNITIADNEIFGCRTAIDASLTINSLISNNKITRCQKYGVNVQSTCSGVTVSGNTIQDVNQQTEYGSYLSVYATAPNTNVVGNNFVDSQTGGIIDSVVGSPTATYSVNATGQITLYSLGVPIGPAIATAGKTWAQIKTAIEANAGWSLTLFAGCENYIPAAVRRTGYRWDANVQQYSVPTVMTTGEPYYYVGLESGATNSQALNNTYKTNVAALPNNHGNLEYFLNSATNGRLDVSIYGARQYYAAAAPTVGTWIRGDVVYNTSPSSGGYVGWVCTAGGTPGTWKTFGVIS